MKKTAATKKLQFFLIFMLAWKLCQVMKYMKNAIWLPGASVKL